MLERWAQIGPLAGNLTYYEAVDVKGTAFLARCAYLRAAFGKDAFDAFFESWRQGEEDFEQDVLPTSILQSGAFLRFGDAAIDRFYEGEVSTHWDFGRASAEWALREGPYKAFFQSKLIDRFLRTTPSLWKAYYSEGEFEAVLDSTTNVINAKVHVPPAYAHVHFELNVMGYLHRGLELAGATVTSYRALKGFTRGDDSVHYAFEIG